MVTFYFVSIVIIKNEKKFCFIFLIIFQIAKFLFYFFKSNTNFLRMESNSASSLKNANQIRKKDSGIIKTLTNWLKAIFNLKSGLNLNQIFYSLINFEPIFIPHLKKEFLTQN